MSVVLGINMIFQEFWQPQIIIKLIRARLQFIYKLCCSVLSKGLGRKKTVILSRQGFLPPCKDRLIRKLVTWHYQQDEDNWSFCSLIPAWTIYGKVLANSSSTVYSFWYCLLVPLCLQSMWQREQLGPFYFYQLHPSLKAPLKLKAVT